MIQKCNGKHVPRFQGSHICGKCLEWVFAEQENIDRSSTTDVEMYEEQGKIREESEKWHTKPKPYVAVRSQDKWIWTLDQDAFDAKSTIRKEFR